ADPPARGSVVVRGVLEPDLAAGPAREAPGARRAAALFERGGVDHAVTDRFALLALEDTFADFLGVKLQADIRLARSHAVPFAVADHASARQHLTGALQDCALWEEVEQHLLNLIRHAGVADIDVEARREPRADAGAQLTGRCIAPSADCVEIELDFLPAVERGALAAGYNRDRFVTEGKVTHAPYCDGGAQLLMREWW